MHSELDSRSGTHEGYWRNALCVVFPEILQVCQVGVGVGLCLRGVDASMCI